jgi:hypothetical protein
VGLEGKKRFCFPRVFGLACLFENIAGQGVKVAFSEIDSFLIKCFYQAFNHPEFYQTVSIYHADANCSSK